MNGTKTRNEVQEQLGFPFLEESRQLPLFPDPTTIYPRNTRHIDLSDGTIRFHGAEVGRGEAGPTSDVQHGSGDQFGWGWIGY